MCFLKQPTQWVEIRVSCGSGFLTQRIRTLILLILGSGLLVCEVASSSLHENETHVPKDEVLSRLLKVFGMDHPGKRDHHHLPPQYMLDLYNAIADSSGVTKTTQPYRANIVRSFPDKDVGHQQRFFFNITASIPAQEQILQAEFHLYKTKTKDKLLHDLEEVVSHLLEIRIYQILSTNSTFTEEGNRLLDRRRISTHAKGWEVFYVKDAVLDWLQKPEENYGLLVTVRNIVGKPADFRLARFAKRHHHHVNKQPILVIFTDDGRSKKAATFAATGHENNGSATDASFELSSGFPHLLNSTHIRSEESKEQQHSEYTRSRFERAAIEPKEIQSNSGCTRHELNVDFEKIGWSSWIISPKWYNAYFCRGECDFPLGQNQWPTNHATVQSIVHELKLHPGLGTPCCVPSKLYSINLLYFDEHENVILKQYDDMVAASCGCH